MIWDVENECKNREKIKENQSVNLIKTVNRVYENVPFYRKKMQDAGLHPNDIRSINDLDKLPFTTKQDLRDNYPYGTFAVPLSEIVRLHSSSGTTGQSVVAGYTRNDLDVWSDVVARCLTSYGITSSDIVQVCYGYGLFTGGLGLHYGIEKIGATVIPISGGNSVKQLQIMKDFSSSVLACTPSYALHLLEIYKELGLSEKDLNLKLGIFGAEPWTDSIKHKIEKSFNIKAMDIYGLSEIIGPGVAYECSERKGLHINEDHFIPEIIDPQSEKLLDNGSEGELVFTTITKEAFPLIRYKTGDLSKLFYDNCACSRTFIKMEKCLARTDDMLIIRGVNIFPSQIESILLSIEGIKPHYLIIVDRVKNLDILEILIEAEKEIDHETLEKMAKINIESILGISVKIRVVEEKIIERSQGKAKRVIDKRTQIGK